MQDVQEECINYFMIYYPWNHEFLFYFFFNFYKKEIA